jgi:hypothetical protein
MADISLIDPYSAQQESIARQRRMAQALQQQAQAPMEMPQTPGVLISPYAGLAKVLQGAYGGYQEAEADKEYRNLVNEARTNQAKDFANVIGAMSAPGQVGVAGQAEIPYEPAQTEKIYGTKPAPITGRGYGFGLQMPDQVISEKVIKPEVPYQAAIAEIKDVPAGYISPDLIASLKDPSMRHFAMAQAMAKLEPKAPISVAPGASLIDARTLKPVFTAPAAAQRPVALSEGQNLYDSNGKLLVTGTPKTTSATPSKLAQLQAEYDAIAAKDKNDPRLEVWQNAIANEVKNVAAERLAWDQKVQAAKDKEPNYTYKEEVDPTTGAKLLIKIDNKGVASEVLNSAGTKVKTEVPKTTPVYSEIVRENKIYKIDLNVPEDKQKAIFIKDVTPDLEKVEVTTKDNLPAFRFFPKTELVALGEIPMQAKGIFLDLAQAGQLPLNWREIPEISSFVRQYLINQAGGITPKFLADLDVRVKEATARLGDQGIKFSATVPRADNYLTLGGAQSNAGAAAPAPTSAALPLPADKDKKKLVNGQTYQTNNGLAKWNAALGQFVPVP